MKQQKSSKKCPALAAVVAIGIESALAAGNWTGAGGDNDIANPNNWGITTGSFSGQDIQWEGSAAFISPLTCSADIEFNRVKVTRADPVVWDLNGKTLTAAGSPAIRTEGNGTSLTISNGVFTSTTTSDSFSTPSFRLFKSDNTVEFVGSGTVATFHHVGIGCEVNTTTPGNNDRLIVRNGATFNVSGDTVIGSSYGGSGNELLVDGGRYVSTSIVKFGNGNTCYSNAITVVNGGRFEADRFYNGGDRIAISNILTVADSEVIMHGAFDLGGKPGKDGMTGNKIVVQGNSSIYTDGGEMTIDYDTEVLFVLPKADRLEGYAPICTKNGKNLSVSADVKLSFDAKSMRAVAREGGAQVVLMSAAGTFTIADTANTVAKWSAAANAAYEGASVAFANKTLTLTIPADRSGLSIFVR